MKTQRYDAIHNVAGIDQAGPLALFAAVVRVALVDAQGGDTDAASWIKSDQCLALCALLIPDDADQSLTPERMQAQLIAQLPKWMREETDA